MLRVSTDKIHKLHFIIKKLCEKKQFSRLRKLLIRYHPADVEEAIRFMEASDIATILKTLGGIFSFQLFEFLDTETQKEVIRYFSNAEVKVLLEELVDDERNSFLKGLDEEIQNQFLSLLTEEERQEAKILLAYEDDTAASIMTKEYACIYSHLTVGESLEEIRRQAPNKETIYTIYVVDEDNRLNGVVSLEKLILADPSLKIERIMNQDYIYIRSEEGTDQAANIIQRYDLLALPVVDENQHLLGIITYDDATDILIQEDTEDIEKFMGFTGEAKEEGYLKQPVREHFKRRFTWTLIPAIMEMASGMVIHSYQEMLNHFFILAFYMPMIAATGGNTGSQSASMIIRSLALGEISFKDFLRVIFKEFRTAFFIGLGLGIFIALRILVFPYGDGALPLTEIAITVSLGILIQVITSSLAGASLPLLAIKLKIDPAVMSSPVLASVVDISGMLIYFNIAKMILGHLLP